MRISAFTALAAALASTASAQNIGNVTLQFITKERAAAFGAYCLDGSLPAFYYRPGAAGKWKIHFRGGAWCTSPADCASRALTELGSSSFWPAEINTVDNAIYGFMDNNSTLNAMFADWNLVFVPYCDGTSATSYRSEPLVVGNQTLYLRGFAILQALVDQLEELGGFTSRTTDFVHTGTSAGGMSSYLHANYLHSRLPATAKMAVMPDAGFFLDAPNFSGQYAWRAEISNAWGPQLWNASAGTNQECLADYARTGRTADQWQCLFPQYVMPYIAAPVFVINSQVDTASIGIVLGLSCSLPAGTCTAAQAAYIHSFSGWLVGNITAAIAARGQRDGAFLSSCYQHEESCQDFDFMGITIGSSTMYSTFSTFYACVPTIGTPAGSPLAAGCNQADWIRVDVPWPGDNSCAPQGVRHGGC